MPQNGCLSKIKNYFFIVTVLLFFSACVTRKNNPDLLTFDDEAPKTSSDKKEIKTNNHEKIDKAMAAFALKEESKDFSEICLDKHFDCFVNEKKYPKNKKKVSRKGGPFASGSKMGLRGEERVQIRYDFYP